MNKTVTKAILSNNLSKKIGISQSLCESIINSIFETVTDLLDKEEILKIQNFGTFKLRFKKERFGLNISHMQPVTVSSRKIINFLAAKNLKNYINS